MKFNINDMVRVRLLPLGRQIAKHEIPPMPTPHEDAEGWSEWQLWQLMSVFGPHIFNGCEMPFEPDIEIPTVPGWNV